MRQRPWKPRSRLRTIIRRSSAVWWTAALALGAATASIASSNLGRAARAADAWGTAQRVWVLHHSVTAGSVLRRGDVALERRPRGVVPVGALGASTSPVGRAAQVRLAAGEVVLANRIAGRGAFGLAAMLDGAHRAIALKNDDSMPALRPGDRVDVLATFDVGDAGEDEAAAEPSFAVASNAEVLAVTARTITVSVTNREAPRVAFALARAAVTVSLRGG
jgi:Flp pilus assembly protein CpaB